MMNKRKGFTLIELLAVIVILGLLMAIAIPSVTKYITESRKKTVVSTIGNYITAMVNEVNDLTYIFTRVNTIYAVPIECIALERGGTNPFGEWHQASNAYWAYVLVQYDDRTSSYRYGYTFKDSAGYGLYPTAQTKLNERGNQIKTGLDLMLPLNGKVTNIASVDKWNGFEVDSSTDLVVLIAESEGNTGDGVRTCTLQQKGNNYANVEEEKLSRPRGVLTNLIKSDNTLITSTPTLTTSSNNTSDTSGLYVSTDTNSGEMTYYFRGNVKNNNVKFAGLDWKIIRINEDGTARLILNGKVGETTHQFNSVYDTYDKMYYSNGSNAKIQVDNWYKTNIEDKGYDSYVATGMFCEQVKVKLSASVTGGEATMPIFTSYTPNFKCSTDGNGKGILNLKVGLITYDEALYAGAYYGKSNSKFYIYNGKYGQWTMSPSGFKDSSTSSYAWFVNTDGNVYDYGVYKNNNFRPVVNLKSDVLVRGTGISDDPYVVLTNK